jgi:hypothetical protein
VPATIVLLALGLAAGCGGNDDDPEPARSTATTQTVPEAPPQPPAQPQVPGSEQDAAIGVVSRYADALQRLDFARSCSLVAAPARSAAAGGCTAGLERFARRSDVLRLARTVPLWESGAVDAGTGAIRGRVKIGFPAEPETRWVFMVVKQPGRPWRLSTPLPRVGHAG